jgi:CDP-paratose 2-epimerase
MKTKSAVVIGGCGFIGAHCVARLMREGFQVLCIDNLSRVTAQANVAWLREIALNTPGALDYVYADVRHPDELEAVLDDSVRQRGRPEVVFHQAAQVTVTLSMTEPRHDFENNALGTFNVLEAVRSFCPEALLVFSSTNKVYGSLKHLETREEEKRYAFQHVAGVGTDQPLDFYSPYGCSKGAADQYVRDYSRIYGLRTLVFRQSCIYGSRQFGHEDQGWVAWFVIAALLGLPTTIYGTGKQVRDLLWIDDLLDAYWSAWQAEVSGEIFNIGGGPENTLSLLELLDILKELSPSLHASAQLAWRPGDQPIYVSDIRDLNTRLGWAPKVPPLEGVHRLWAWVNDNQAEIAAMIRKT